MLLVAGSEPLGLAVHLAGRVKLLDGLLRKVEAGGLNRVSELGDAADAHD